MSPQAVRLSSPPPNRWRPPRVSARRYGALLGIVLLLVLLGRVLLPLAILLSVGLAALLWLTPEIAYWLDEALWLHRLPFFGGDHRQMALASLAYLALASILGSVLLGGASDSSPRPAAATATAIAPERMAVVAEPTVAPPATTAIVAPSLAPIPTFESAERDDPLPTTSPLRSELQPPLADPTLPPLRPTFTPLATRPATLQPALATAGPTAGSISTPSLPTPISRSTPAGETQRASAEPGAEITGTSSSVSPGGRASLQARVTPGASCDLSIQYAGGSAGGPGGLRAGDDGICVWTWVVPMGAQPGPAKATLTVKSGGKTQTRQTTISVG